MKSIWTETVEMPLFKTLEADAETDTLIIGGGMAGVLCAFMLERAGMPYLLVEADRICGGVTAGTTAKITLQHGFFADQLIREKGCDRAKMYMEANCTALETYRELCGGMDCDYAEADNIVYTRGRREHAEKEAAALGHLGVESDVLSALPIPVDCTAAVRVRGQAQFHPLKLAKTIAQGLNIRENTRVTAIAPGRAETEHGVIQAKRIVIATHFPFVNNHGGYFMKLYQNRSYVLALENAESLPGMYVDEDKKGFSFRQYGGMLLLGGGSHRTGSRGGGWQELREFAAKHYPGAREAAHWAAQDCMSLDGMPYIGQYGRRTPEWYVTTGFNKWGMTGAMVSALLLRDMLLGRQNDWQDVFAPSRSMLYPQLAVNLAESTVNLLRPTAPRCPHLGCALKYNRQEHSWDCPCHGSRFAENGELLDNPAMGGLKKK